MIHIRKLLIALLMTAAAQGLFAQTIPGNVVATTEWTAAFCRAAGLENVRVLAPAALRHPPDYELKPSDIPALAEADLIVFAGYEGMMERIRANVAGRNIRMVQIETVYAPGIIEASVRKIAEAAGTQDFAEKELAAIAEAWADAARIIKEAGLAGKKTAAHRFQAPFAEAAGLDVVAIFGPPPPGPRLIGEIAGSGAELILDNWHNPVSMPLREILNKANAVELINFPGRHGTVSLKDVIRDNAETLAASAR